MEGSWGLPKNQHTEECGAEGIPHTFSQYSYGSGLRPEPSKAPPGLKNQIMPSCSVVLLCSSRLKLSALDMTPKPQ